MNTFSKTTEEVRKRIIEQDLEAAREQSAKNYLQRLKEYNVSSITELNESQLADFVQSLRSLEQ